MVGIELDHTIIPAGDAEASARWLADLFGLAEPTPVGHFWQVSTANGVDLDFATRTEGPSASLHYAFVVGEDDFDAIHARIVERGMDHWADPGRRRPGEINRRGGGRGVYFLTGDQHLFEILTRPSGT